MLLLMLKCFVVRQFDNGCANCLIVKSMFRPGIIDTFEMARNACLTIQRPRSHAEDVILRPLPRHAGKLRRCTWNSPAAYRLERTLIRGGDLATVITLGRYPTRKMGRKRSGIRGCEPWFQTDGVHLSEEGYARLASAAGAFPMWLRMTTK